MLDDLFLVLASILAGWLAEFLFEGFVEVAFVGEAQLGGYFRNGEVAVKQACFHEFQFVIDDKVLQVDAGLFLKVKADIVFGFMKMGGDPFRLMGILSKFFGVRGFIYGING
jgi:hypothetical protein